MIKKWLSINDEYEQIWSKFYEKFKFNPSIHIEDWPSIKTEFPQLKLNVEKCLVDDFSASNYDDLARIIFKLFIKLLDENEEMYALDWQHTAYRFNPQIGYDESKKFNTWIVPVLPFGEYYIFITKDFENMWFGHPWEQSVTLVGKKIVEEGKKILNDLEQLKIYEYDK